MLELTLTIATILLIHYLITTWRRRKASHQRLIATNQIEKRGRRRLAPIFIKLISRGKI